MNAGTWPAVAENHVPAQGLRVYLLGGGLGRVQSGHGVGDVAKRSINSRPYTASHQLGPIQLVPDAPDQAEAVQADAAQARLMVIRRAGASRSPRSIVTFKITLEVGEARLLRGFACLISGSTICHVAPRTFMKPDDDETDVCAEPRRPVTSDRHLSIRRSQFPGLLAAERDLLARTRMRLRFAPRNCALSRRDGLPAPFYTSSPVGFF